MMKGLGLKKKFRRKRFESKQQGEEEGIVVGPQTRGGSHVEERHQLLRTASLSSSSSSSSSPSFETGVTRPDARKGRWAFPAKERLMTRGIRWRRRNLIHGMDSASTFEANATTSGTIASTCTSASTPRLAGEKPPARQRRRQQHQREFQIFEDERVLNSFDASTSNGGEGTASGCHGRTAEDGGGSYMGNLSRWLVSWVSESSGSSSPQSHLANLLLADSFVVLLVLRFMPQLYVAAILLVLLVTGASLLKQLVQKVIFSRALPSRRPKFSFRHSPGSNSDCASGRRKARQSATHSPQLHRLPFSVVNRKADSDISQLTSEDDDLPDDQQQFSKGSPLPSTWPGSPGDSSSSSTTEDRTGTSLTYASSSYDSRTMQQISYMISQLNDEEQELAARTNYTYFCTRDESLRRSAVQHMCARYLRSKKQPDLALAKMKETLAFRKEMNVDHLRVALHGDNVAKCETAQKLKSHVEHKAVYVQGYDKEGRSTFIFEPHRVVEYCHEISLKHHVWTLERAIACSKHPDKTINAVINCGEFVAKHHAPPVNLAKDFFKALRSHYTGHVNKIFLVAPPRSIGFLWSVFKPFVSERTKNNVVFVTKPNQLSEFYTVSQAKPWMLSGGQLTEDFDVEEYIESPFDTAFT